MNPADTIVALASGRPAAGGGAPGTGGTRALLRISGAATPELLAAAPLGVFEQAIPLQSGDDARIVPARLRLRADEALAGPGAAAGLGGGTLPCLVLGFPGPRSYTGEHAAELLVPGNAALVERVLATLLARDGVRLATPGEFSARAYLNGRLTLAQAEGVGATIAARNDEELAAAERLLTGETGRVFRVWCDELVNLLALVEAGIDFTDQEDVVPISPDRLAHRLNELAHAISAHLGAAHGVEHPEGLPTVALAGPPNAGKSTLFNTLLGRRRAVVSDVPGTTRDVLAERLDLSDGHASSGAGAEGVMLLDLAGLDQSLTHGAIDRDAQERANAALERADVVLLCDPRGRFDVRLPGAAGKDARTIIRVRTKADLPSSGAPEAGVLSICALDGYNLPVLRRAIADAISVSHAGGAGGEEGGGGGAWLVPRHRRALTRTLDSLRGALAHVQPRRRERALDAPELTAGELRTALDFLGELTGEVTPDDVIGRVFATFCVGK